MPLVNAKCLKCEKEITIDDGKELIYCPHCNQVQYSSDAIKFYCGVIQKNKGNYKGTHEEQNKTETDSSKTIIIRLILLLIISSAIIIPISQTLSDENKETYISCDWCGKKEYCHSYSCQKINGYNNDGSIKFAYEINWFSDDCYKKAKNSSRWTIISKK